MDSRRDNLLAILKWSLAQSSDGTQESTFNAMNEEDRNFLAAALSEAIKDEPSRLEVRRCSMMRGYWLIRDHRRYLRTSFGI